MSVAAQFSSVPLRWQRLYPGKSYAKFLSVMRAAAAAAPDRADLRLQFAKALFSTDHMAEIVERMSSVIFDWNAEPRLLELIGRAALETQNYQVACESFQHAIAKGSDPAFGYLAEALHRVGRDDEALDAALRALEFSVADFAAIKVVARVLLKRDEGERLWNLCVELRARGAWGAWFSAVMSCAAATLGIEDEFNAVIDRARWFSVTQLPISEEFNHNLAAELAGLRPTGAEMRVDALEFVGGPLAQSLLGRIRDAVDVYAAERQIFGKDPMNKRRPASVSLYSWLIMVHENKHHGWHIHQAGWISGVYYVKVPEVGRGDDVYPGSIEFGPFPFGDDERILIARRWHVVPKPGMLVLFPSYYGHRTIPTGVGDLRVSVPFDVRPSVSRIETD